MTPFIAAALIFSLAGACLWYVLYRLSAASRIKKARAQGKEADLSRCRIVYTVTGIIGQAAFWSMMYLISHWKGFP